MPDETLRTASDRVNSSIRIAAVMHGVAAAASLVAAIVLTVHLPEMTSTDDMGDDKVAVVWFAAFFSLLTPLPLTSKATKTALRMMRALTCFTSAFCIAMIGLMIHSLVVGAQGGRVDYFNALALGLFIFALFIHATATQMLSDISIRRRLSSLTSSLTTTVVTVRRRASMAVGGDWQESRDKKLRAAQERSQQKQSGAVTAASEEVKVNINVT